MSRSLSPWVWDHKTQTAELHTDWGIHSRSVRLRWAYFQWDPNPMRWVLLSLRVSRIHHNFSFAETTSYRRRVLACALCQEYDRLKLFVWWLLLCRAVFNIRDFRIVKIACRNSAPRFSSVVFVYFGCIVCTWISSNPSSFANVSVLNLLNWIKMYTTMGSESRYRTLRLHRVLCVLRNN